MAMVAVAVIGLVGWGVPTYSRRHDAPDSLPRPHATLHEIVRDFRSLIDDTEVALAFYGAIVYLAVISALESQTQPPAAAAAISAVVATATVLYLAHVFAALVPKSARAGRLHAPDLWAALRHDVPLLASALVPSAPLLLAARDVISLETGYRFSVRLTLAMLFALAVTLSRREGLRWKRALVAGVVIIAVTVGVIWLESHVH